MNVETEVSNSGELNVFKVRRSFYAFNGQLTRPVQEMKVIKAVELYSTFTAESVAVFWSLL